MKSIKNYYQQFILLDKESRYFLIFNFLFFIRIISALPIALYKVEIFAAKYSYQKYVTLAMILLAGYILFSERDKFIVFIKERKNMFIIFGLILFAGIINGAVTFYSYDMSLLAPVISTSRFVFLILIFCIVNLFKQSVCEKWIDVNINFLIFYVIGIGMIMLIFSFNEKIQLVPRLTGPFLHPNQFGYMLLLIITLSLYKWEETKNYKFYGSVLLLAMLLLFKSGSMNSLLALMFFSGWLILHFKLYKNKYVIGAVIIGCIVVTLLFPSVIEIYLYRLADSFDFENGGFSLSSASSLRWRFETWYGYLEFILKQTYTYWIGLGMGTHRFLFAYQFENNLSEQFFWAPGTHNDYLAFWFDFGILGLIFIFYLIYKIFVVFKRVLIYRPAVIYLYFFFFTLLFMMIFDNFIDSLMGYYTLFLFSMILLKPKTDAENYKTKGK